MSYRKKDYKDLEKWQDTKRKGKRRYYKSTQGYARRGWTEEENRIILEHKRADRELSEQLGRSVQAIQTRRCRLKQESAKTTL